MTCVIYHLLCVTRCKELLLKYVNCEVYSSILQCCIKSWSVSHVLFGWIQAMRVRRMEVQRHSRSPGFGILNWMTPTSKWPGRFSCKRMPALKWATRSPHHMKSPNFLLSRLKLSWHCRDNLAPGKTSYPMKSTSHTRHQELQKIEKLFFCNFKAVSQKN